MKNKVMVDSRFRRQGANHDEYLLVLMVKQDLFGISPALLVVFYRRLGIHLTGYKAIM